MFLIQRDLLQRFRFLNDGGLFSIQRFGVLASLDQLRGGALVMVEDVHALEQVLTGLSVGSEFVPHVVLVERAQHLTLQFLLLFLLL